MIIAYLILVTSFTFSQTPRSRVQIQNGTLVTDKGTLLRGATDLSPFEGFVWEDIKADIAGIKDLGLNSLHLYSELPYLHEPGDRVNYIDSIVAWTREDSLYLVMTTSWYDDGEKDIDFIREFWRFYADRYKDETHMIFEICNEPQIEYPYDSLTIAMEREMYDTIRSLAPETHILLMTGGVQSAKYLLEHTEKLGEGIDWSNASLAAHGYTLSTEEVRPFIDSIWAAGYPLIITEFHSPLNEYVNLAYTRVFEDRNLSYLHFVSIDRMNNSPNHFKNKIESSEIRWTPDFGTWPESITEINYRSPYEWRSAMFYDEGFGIRIPGIFGPTINYISHNDYIAFYYLDFEEGPFSFTAECCSDLDGGNIEIHLDSLDGHVVATCPVGSTGDWEVFESYSCSIDVPFSGVHHVYLVFKDTGSSGLFDLKRIKFDKEGPNSVESKNSEIYFSVYPNPAQEFIKLKCNEKSILKIYNLYGQLMIQKELSEYENTIPISSLSPGSYIVKITDNTQIYSEILIIE